ncbi:MFS transporter [Adlercreutzia sp. ZJ154]|uniref:MFS transporter n=1 Tax=Adlercreutzia sp. ZJ154 TaxID=2709790 RepID=UPI0013ECC9AC|nr:MFS transporter [Adlercreutzia sp. ZJ154]
MSKFDPKIYAGLLRVRQAYAFEIGCFLMRFYAYMMNIGTVTMVTLAGYSFFIAGLTSSVIALSTFFISPRVSKLVDQFGQHKVVPAAAAITIAGLAIMLANVVMHGPEWVLFVAAIPMGFMPNPQALARARWTFLIRSGRLGSAAPDLRTMFSYEGVLDDVGFMFSPSISIALASAITPIAGLFAGGVSFVIGVLLLTMSRATEPTPGWGTSDTSEKLQRAQTDQSVRQKSVLRTSSVVRVLFALMFFTGAFFGVFDATTVALAEELGNPNIASIVLIVASCVSMVTGILFGMIHIRIPQYAQLVGASVAIGLAYGSMFLVNSALSLFIMSTIAALFYAPMLITANATCERAVPGSRITEAITWMNAGATCGMAFGPSVSGIIVDNFGAAVSFDFGAVLALAVPVTALLCMRILRRGVTTTYTIAAQSKK